MSENHAHTALSHIEAVRAARYALEEEYAKGQSRRDPVIASLNHAIGDGLKLAEVHATLAVAEALDKLHTGPRRRGAEVLS